MGKPLQLFFVRCAPVLPDRMQTELIMLCETITVAQQMARHLMGPDTVLHRSMFKREGWLADRDTSFSHKWRYIPAKTTYRGYTRLELPGDNTGLRFHSFKPYYTRTEKINQLAI